MTKFCQTLIGLLLSCLIISELSDAVCRFRSDSKSKKKENFLCQYGIQDVTSKIIIDSLPDVHQLDPLFLSNSSLLTIKLHGGTFSGLSTLKNVTPIAVRCDADQDMSIETTLEMRNITMDYDWSCAMGLFSGKSKITSPVTHIHVKAILCMSGPNTGIELTDLNMVQLEKFRFKLTGLSPFNGIFNMGGDAVLYVMREYMIDNMKNTLFPHIERFFASMLMPF